MASCIGKTGSKEEVPFLDLDAQGMCGHDHRKGTVSASWCCAVLCKYRHVLSPSFCVVGVQGGSSSDSGLYSKKFPEHLRWEGLAPRLLTELLFSEFSPIQLWCMGSSKSQDLGFYRKSSSLPPGPLYPAAYASLQNGTHLPSASPGSVIQERAK